MTESLLKQLHAVLFQGPLRFADEAELQRLLFARLQEKFGTDIRREFIFSPKERVDFFWVSEGLAIEVKTKTGRSPILRQLDRYAQYDIVKGIVLVVPFMMSMPEELRGKPVTVFEYWKYLL